MPRTKMFFVSDVHGSERCFRKFVNAGKFYGAKVLILGGDITGKMIVPILERPDGSYECVEPGSESILSSHDELDARIKIIRDSGSYPYVTSRGEYRELSADPNKTSQLFRELMKKTVADWVKLAEERLEGTGVSCYISPGNDDYLDIDEALNSSSFVINPEQKVVMIDEEHSMITLGTSNPTPWHSPREVSEEDLSRLIEDLANRVENQKKAVFNIHVPPIDSPIDEAPRLDDNLKPILSGGQMVMTAAGSTAVRKAIERCQPLMGLHGHIHESRGYVKIGRTTCFNPGSDYGSGVLRGLLCEIEGDRVRSFTLTAG